MATTSLLKAVVSCRPQLPTLGNQPLRWNLLSRRSHTPTRKPWQLPGPCSTTTAASLTPNSLSSRHRATPDASGVNSQNSLGRKRVSTDGGSVLDAVMKTFKTLSKTVAVAALLALLLVHDPNAALAASGGRMGGRAFSSSSSASRRYSAPSGSGFSSSVPYYAPSPFGGVYVAPAFGFGVGSGSGFFLLMMGFAVMILLSGFLSDRTEDNSVLSDTQKTSVLKLQVGLLGMARSFQKDLDQIAEAADTSSSEGLSYVLTETTLSLLRHPDCCISGYSSVDMKRSIEGGEKLFNKLSIEERGKIDEETLVNVNSIKRQSASMQRNKGFSNEYIVITILVAAEGVHKLPIINSSSGLREALQKLASISSGKILAVEVLWTPQDENDTLTERELLEDYPLLRPL